MNAYLAKLRDLRTLKTLKTGSEMGFEGFEGDQGCRVFNFGASREVAFEDLELACPVHVDPADWQRAIADGRRFLAQWGEQAKALGWTARDLFGLHEAPEQPHERYRRLSRHDVTGLIWLLQGRAVIAMTESTAVIRTRSGTLVYRRQVSR